MKSNYQKTVEKLIEDKVLIPMEQQRYVQLKDKNGKPFYTWIKEKDYQVMMNKRPKNLPIKFYLYNRYLGIGFISECSTPNERREAARKIGITFYNGIIIQNRDLRKTRIIDNNGKKRRDIDFVTNFRSTIINNGF